MANALRFGVICTSTVEAARAAWQPFFADLSASTGLEIDGEYPATYTEVVEGLRSGRLQLAWLSARAALDAIDGGSCAVFAQMIAANGSPGYHALLLRLQEQQHIGDLSRALSQAAELRLAMGETNSTSGYLMPMHGLFGPRRIKPDKHFAHVQHGSHAQNLSALLAGEVDICAYNTEELDRLQAGDSALHARLKVLWQSNVIIPKDPLLWRCDLPLALQTLIATAVCAYGAHAAQQLTLKRMFDLAGFKQSSNAQLKPILDFENYRELAALLNDARLDASEKSTRLAATKERYARLSAQLDA